MIVENLRERGLTGNPSRTGRDAVTNAITSPWDGELISEVIHGNLFSCFTDLSPVCVTNLGSGIVSKIVLLRRRLVDRFYSRLNILIVRSQNSQILNPLG